MSYDKETATVTTACEVSFAVGNMNYGTITVPVGTKVFRHVIDNKVSDWFLEHDDMVKLCPESSKVNGKPSSFYLHDACHYGITMPTANVGGDGRPMAKHNSIHY
jgi:acetoacetate decarboxylase